MTPRRAQTTCTLVLLAAAMAVCAWIPATRGDVPGSSPPSSAAAATPSPTAPKKGKMIIGTVPDTGQFLPDTAVILRVGDQTTTAIDYAEAYFSSAPELRPGQDSLGRAQFLNTLIDKGVLDAVVKRVSPPLGFEDRQLMREHEVRVLSNMLYQRAVVDSVRITDEDIARLRRNLGYRLHLRHILFEDQITAQRVRDDLVAGRIAWKVAHAQYSRATNDSGPDGDIGWHTAMRLEAPLAAQLFGLQEGGLSALYDDDDGTHVVQLVESRPLGTPPAEFVRATLERQIRAARIPQGAEAVLRKLRIEAAVTYDTTNILWAVRRFVQSSAAFLRPAPQDTGRVLARTRDGAYTMGALASFYQQTSPMFQVKLNTFNRLRNELDTAMLEPYKAELARRLGLDRDPATLDLMERRRLEIQVEHLYQDSIYGRVQVSARERRSYFDRHLSRRMTDAKVQYAIFPRTSTDAADSVVARLRAGEHSWDILRADSLRGSRRGRILWVDENNQEIPFKRLLFEEMKPGDIRVYGPLPESGQYLVLQELALDPGHLLTYREAEQTADESARNEKAERLMRRFIDRHRRGIPIVARPELLMRIRLVISGV